MSRRLVSDLSYGALCLLVSINSIYGTISLKEDAVGAIINRRVEKIVGFIAKPCADGTASAIDRDRQDRKNISSCEAQPLPADAHLFRNEEELATMGQPTTVSTSSFQFIRLNTIETQTIIS